MLSLRFPLAYFLAVCLVIFLAVAHQAFCGPPPATQGVGSASVPVMDSPAGTPALPRFASNAANPPSPLGLGKAIEDAAKVPPLPAYHETRTSAAEIPPNPPLRKGGMRSSPFRERGNEGDLSAENSGHILTDLEYQMFRQMVEAGGATPLQVALVNAAVKGTSLLIMGVAWILVLVIFRYVFNRWFDEDVYKKTWPSVIVISIMIFGTALVLIAAVR